MGEESENIFLKRRQKKKNNRNMKQCSVSLTMREIQIQITVWHCFTFHMAIIKNYINLGKDKKTTRLSSSHAWMWELGYKESWAPKNWCFWTVVLEKTLWKSLGLQGDPT